MVIIKLTQCQYNQILRSKHALIKYHVTDCVCREVGTVVLDSRNFEILSISEIRTMSNRFFRKSGPTPMIYSIK